jgi:serine/threonine-protein kinase RsbW
MMTEQQQTPANTQGGPDPGQSWRQYFIQTPAEMWRVFARLESEMQALGYADNDIFAVKLVLGEAIVNAVKHGHRGDPTKRVELRFQVTEEEVTAEVLDQGPGFDPTKVPSPLDEENIEREGGRGLFLMSVYMTWVRFNERGNTVTLCRKRSHLN